MAFCRPESAITSVGSGRFAQARRSDAELLSLLSERARSWGSILSHTLCRRSDRVRKGNCGRRPVHADPSKSVKADHYTMSRTVLLGSEEHQVRRGGPEGDLRRIDAAAGASGRPRSTWPRRKRCVGRPGCGVERCKRSLGFDVAIRVCPPQNGKPASPLTDARVRQR